MILLIIFLDDFHKESLCKIPVYFLDSSFLFFFFFFNKSLYYPSKNNNNASSRYFNRINIFDYNVFFFFLSFCWSFLLLDFDIYLFFSQSSTLVYSNSKCGCS